MRRESSVFSIKFALVQIAMLVSDDIFCYKYFSSYLTQRISCELSFASFPVSCLPASLFRHPETKPRTDNDSSKEAPAERIAKAHSLCVVV